MSTKTFPSAETDLSAGDDPPTAPQPFPEPPGPRPGARPVGPLRRVRRVLDALAVRGLSVAARTGEAGQGTVEYALVLLGAAAVALALVAWVTRSDAVSRLFDAVVGRILSRA